MQRRNKELARDEKNAIFVDITKLGIAEITRKKETRPKLINDYY